MVSKRCSIHPLRLKEELKRVVKKLLLLKFIVKTNKWCVSPIIVAIEGLKPRLFWLRKFLYVDQIQMINLEGMSAKKVG